MLTAGDDLEAEAVTLAEVAAAAGMTTAAFVEGAPGGADFGLAQGFGSYQTVAAPGAAGVAWMQQHAKDDFLLLIAGWGSRSLEGAAKLMGDDNEGIGDRVVEVLASRDGDSPVMFNDDEMARIREWYAARVQVIDAAVADFMAVFHETGLADRATLVVMGTNGLALAEHDDLFGETVYAPVTRVPMLLRFPGGADAGANTKVVEALDVMPTLVERLGVELPTGVQGSSLMPLITGASTPPYVAFGEGPGRGGQRFVALAGYRAVVSGADTKSELFHTASDPLELEDIADAEPDKLTKLQGDLEAWTKMVSIASLNPELRTEADLDDDTLKQLKSLGYVQ